ncbi:MULTISPECIES: PH domain-containing protein [Clostridium]|uniref:PH domain-containing protein n=1 Tax=Clostridium frigoriphilum TaxID=443253 RepID=A0ABU7URY4_9CLOT|nr:PH domain-containing protein [Clostridium sp. DSM 17811]MBU3101115.1 PH domain-containing protein [Clostridium sp. DSM 17811]
MKKISPFSKKMWTIDGLVITSVFLVIAVALSIFLGFDSIWKYILIFSVYVIAIIIFINSLFMPKYKYKKFSYDMDEEKIILKYGVVTEINVIIPMSRVQYVDTEQGIILKKYKLINLTIHTAGGAYKIPYLESEIGNELQLSITKTVQERSI